MSSETTGAASAAPLATVTRNGATPALADQWEAEALDAIENVQDLAEAERLLGNVTVAAEAMRVARLGEDRERRWKALRLKAEARYGELLGPKQPGKRTDKQPVTSGHRSSDVDRKQAERARKVADVKKIDPEGFEDYVANDPSPSRNGLLRDVPNGKKQPEAKQQAYNNRHWENEEVIVWVGRRMRAGRTRDQIFEESKNGEHDWPLPASCWLPKNTVDMVRAIVRDRKQRGDTGRRRPSESGKRLRQLHAEKRAGRGESDLWHLQRAVTETVSMLELFDIPDLDWTEETEFLVLEIYDDLERHTRWNDAAINATIAHMGELSRRRKYELLRARADDPSSTPNERATAARLASAFKPRARLTT